VAEKQKNKRKSAVVGDNERLTKRGLIYLGTEIVYNKVNRLQSFF